MQLLKQIRLKGWKSIEDQTIDLSPLNVIVGCNGAGKSNLISFFRLLNLMLATTPRLREAVAIAGGPNTLLHFGSKQTPILELELVFQAEKGESRYFARLAAAASESLVFLEEKISFQANEKTKPKVLSLGAGHSESNLIAKAEEGEATARVLLHLLRNCRVLHFHDTSERAEIRMQCDKEANRFLAPDGRNLAAMLYLYRETAPITYRRIRSAMKQVVPYFDDFVLEPQELNNRNISLRWTQTNQPTEYDFGAHQLSDGSLRFIALATLLEQPKDRRPLLIALDEPELGLHPSAISVLASMAKTASLEGQVLMATQSSVLLDYVTPDDLVVVNNKDGKSEFERLSSDELSQWKEDFSLSDLWVRNAIGGGPY